MTLAPGPARPVILASSDGTRFEFECGPGQTVLDAAAAAGEVLPSSCRQGTCGSCHATVTEGSYELGAHSPAALSADQRERGDVLLCRTYPAGPLSAALPYEASRILHGEIPVRDSVIAGLDAVARDVVRLELRLQPGDKWGTDCQFEPGQFMALQIPGQDATRAYSLANTGNWEGRAEFFIRLLPDGLFSSYLRERARLGDRIIVHGPQGAFGLHDRGLRPRWFVAGGTGLAPLLAMVRQMAEWQEPQPARLFFGLNEEDDIFGGPELKSVAEELPGFSYEICVWRPGSTWPGPSSTPADLVAARLAAEPVKPDVYVCGPPGLVDSVEKVATAAGLPSDQVFFERFLPS